MLPMTNDDKMQHSAATICYLCGEKFNWEDENFRKVRDYCHNAGKY